VIDDIIAKVASIRNDSKLSASGRTEVIIAAGQAALAEIDRVATNQNARLNEALIAAKKEVSPFPAWQQFMASQDLDRGSFWSRIDSLQKLLRAEPDDLVRNAKLETAGTSGDAWTIFAFALTFPAYPLATAERIEAAKTKWVITTCPEKFSEVSTVEDAIEFFNGNRMVARKAVADATGVPLVDDVIARMASRGS
jgi:hypothetical protein